MTMLETDVELVLLEETWNEECKCESTHLSSTCSIEVVALAKGCTPATLVCQVSVNIDQIRMRRGVICSNCLRPASECWTFVPI